MTEYIRQETFSEKTDKYGGIGAVNSSGEDLYKTSESLGYADKHKEKLEIVENAFKENIEDEIKLTEKAIKEIKRIKLENNIPDETALRVGVEGGGCSGMRFKISFSDKKNINDKEIIKDGIKILIDVKSLFYMSGTEIGYTDGLNGKGFTFDNPLSVKSCGCGESFGV